MYLVKKDFQEMNNSPIIRENKMFKQIDKADYTSVNNHTYKYLPNAVDIHLVLNGYSSGEAYQDNDGELLIIRGQKTPFAVYTGLVDSEKIKSIAQILDNYNYCALSLKQCDIDSAVIDVMLAAKYESIRRLRFTSENANITPTINQLSDQFEVIRIDNLDKLMLCYQYQYLLDLYGNADNYFRHAYGIGVMDKTTGNIVSETHAFLGDGITEPTVTTLPDYRGLSLSTIANFRLMLDLMEKNYTFEWTCDSDNIGSFSIAQRLGLQQINDYWMFFRDSR